MYVAVLFGEYRTRGPTAQSNAPSFRYVARLMGVPVI